jgi:hypothetical protein
MLHRNTMPAVALALLALGTAPDRARAQASDPVPYALQSGSEFQTGCFGACACPIIGRAMSGSFVLTQVSDNGLFRTFDVTQVDWKSSSATEVLRLTGSGTYRVGGEVALEHQLVLDVSLNGGPPRRFDSGLVSGGGEFPKIDIRAALHDSACYDTVLAVRAAPATPSATGPGIVAATVSGLEPNPFRVSTRVDIALPAASRVDLGIFDVRGRVVRSLARGVRLNAGRYSFVWNGDRDQGLHAASGVYVVRLAVDGRTSLRRIVKLQ